METTQLTTSAYWESEENDLRLNPRRKLSSDGLKIFIEVECGIRASVVLATSGSSGQAKFVVLSKKAMLASAQAVVDHCMLIPDDVWLAGLSGYHVGGLAIYARAFLTGSRVEELVPGKWDREGRRFVESCERSQPTLTSMTPTHLYDLVTHGVRAPGSLRGVLLGGGRIEASLVARAQELGWPLWPSYGMTESASQIATDIQGQVSDLPILPGWECRVASDGRLAIRGEALFSGYIAGRPGTWEFEEGVDAEGWFLTGDRGTVQEGRLSFLERADDLVKVSGVLVSLSRIHDRASALALENGTQAAVVPIPDERRENDLVLVVERQSDLDVEAMRERLNSQLDGIERIVRVRQVEALPRMETGKLDQSQLRVIAAGE
ncbi:MAG: AMP-binding protein [Verrucomicrobiota bacterium]